MAGFTVTQHFHQRMAEREITPSQIVETLQHGKRIFDFTQRSVRYIYHNIHLVVKGDNLLVTVFRSSARQETTCSDSRKARIRYRKKMELLKSSNDCSCLTAV